MLSKSVPGFVIGVLVTMVVSFVMAPRSDAAISLENRELRERVAGLESEIEAKWTRTPPPGADPIFSPHGFKKAVTRIFGATDSDLPHLSRVDCSEYPCIAWVKSPGGFSSALVEFVSSPEFSAIKHEGYSVVSIGHNGPHDQDSDTTLAAISIFLSDSEDQKATIEKELDARMEKTGK